MHQLSIKLNPETLVRIDLYIKALMAAQPGAKASIGSVIRAGLEDFLKRQGV